MPNLREIGTEEHFWLQVMIMEVCKMTLHDTPNVFIYYVLVVLMLESLLDIYCTGQFPVLPVSSWKDF